MCGEKKDDYGQQIDQARKWWDSENTAGSLKQISQIQFTQILEQNRQYYEDRSAGEPAKLAGVDLSQFSSQLREAVLVDADLRWANLYGAQLHRANLWRAQLIGAMLIRAEFDAEAPDALPEIGYTVTAEHQETKLTGTITQIQSPALNELKKARRKGADLTHADLRSAHLRDASLSAVTGLCAESLSGTDLTNAKLPSHIEKFEALAQVAETSKNASGVFFGLMAASLYCWLTIATTTDAALIINTASSPLPIIGTQIPLAGFYWAAPMILIAVFFYFLLYLQRLWRELAGLPAVFPDGKALDDKAYPWLMTGLVRAHFERLRLDRRPLSRIENLLSLFLAWWVVPLTLVAFWLRYLPRHDWYGTSLHVILVTVGTAFGVHSYRLAVHTLRGEQGPAPVGPDEPFWTWARHSVPSLWPGKRFAFGLALIVALSVWAAVEPGHDPLSFAGFPTSADLREADLSAKPPDWKVGEIERVRGGSSRKGFEGCRRGFGLFSRGQAEER